MPIYSDVESSKDKIIRLAIPFQKIAAISLVSTMILWLIMTFTTGVIHIISKWRPLGINNYYSVCHDVNGNLLSSMEVQN